MILCLTLNLSMLDMLMLTVEHGQAAMRIPLLLKMNAIATQLLMNEI